MNENDSGYKLSGHKINPKFIVKDGELTPSTLDKQTIQDLLCTALEGGSNYWIDSVTHNHKETNVEYWSETLGDAKGKMEITDEANEVYKLDNSDALKAIPIMRTKYPRHYNDAFNDNHDATTADVFLQIIVFGEVIYG